MPRYLSLIVLIFIAGFSGILWATPKVGFDVTLTETYTDNIKRTADNKEESYSTEVTPSVYISDQGAKTDYNIRYKYRDIKYSGGDLNDRTENSGFASINRYEFDRSLNLFAKTSILNVNQKIDSFFDDLNRNERMETVTHTAGANYNTGARQYYDIAGGLQFRKTKTDDNAVDSQGYTGNLNLANGTVQKKSYWQFGSSFAKEDNSSDSHQAAYDGLIGAFLTDSLSVFAQANHEKAAQNGRDDIIFESWGVGLGWKGKKLSSSLALNRTEEGGNEKFISATLNWQPSARTSFDLSYGRRFFGETYAAAITHGTRRLRQSLRMTDSVTSFSQSVGIVGALLCSVDESGQIDLTSCIIANDISDFGDDRIPIGQSLFNEINEDQILNRTLTYNLSYTRKKSTFSGSVLWNRTKNLSESLSSQDYQVQKGGTLSWAWNATRQTQLTARARIKRTKDDNDNSVEVTDYAPSLSIAHQINKDLTGSLTYTYEKREADEPEDEYEENRISASLVARF